MKIFNRENNQPIVYIQKKNIKAIIKHEDKAPSSIYKLAATLNLSDKDKTDDEDFVRITTAKDIEFISGLDWIPDYRYLRDLPDDELEKIVIEESTKNGSMHLNYLSLTEEQQIANSQIQTDYSKKDHAIKDITSYLLSRQGKNHTPISIPLTIDGMESIIESSGTLRLGISMDHKKILIERKNGKNFEKGYRIDPFELQSGLMILVAESEALPKTSGKITIDVLLDPTNRYLVAEHSFETEKNYDLPIEEQSPAPTRLKPQQKKKSIFQRVFKSNKKDEN